jgi:hypothetical protein
MNSVVLSFYTEVKKVRLELASLALLIIITMSKRSIIMGA